MTRCRSARPIGASSACVRPPVPPFRRAHDFAFASYYGGLGAYGFSLGAPRRPVRCASRPSPTASPRCGSRWARPSRRSCRARRAVASRAHHRRAGGHSGGHQRRPPRDGPRPCPVHQRLPHGVGRRFFLLATREPRGAVAPLACAGRSRSSLRWSRSRHRLLFSPRGRQRGDGAILRHDRRDAGSRPPRSPRIDASKRRHRRCRRRGAVAARRGHGDLPDVVRGDRRADRCVRRLRALAVASRLCARRHAVHAPH